MTLSAAELAKDTNFMFFFIDPSSRVYIMNIARVQLV